MHSHRTARYQVLLLAAASAAAACGPRVADAPAPSTAAQAANPPVQAVASAPSCGGASGPQVGEIDGGYKLIWTRPAQAPINGSCSADLDMLYVTRVGLNDASLALDLRLESVDSRDARRGRVEAPRLKLLVDDCLVRAPAIAGSLAFGGSDGRVVIARRTLPRGDLTLIFEAFDKEYSMLFANDDRGLRTITPEEAKNEVDIPGDPAHGIEPSRATITPNCAERGLLPPAEEHAP